MKKARIAVFTGFLVFLFFLTFFPRLMVYGDTDNGGGVRIPAATLKIDRINNLNKNVVQGQKFSFPSTVTALMSDGSIRSQRITWNSTKLSTTTVKSFSFSGKVKGYSDSIKLYVKVLPKTPATIIAKKSYTGWVKISWAAVTGATGYNLYYSNDEENWEKWNSTVTKNSAMLSGVENGVELFFKVTSIVSGIESLKSRSAYFTMLSRHLPHYPNFPSNPDFNVDKTNGSFQGTDGIYYYKYSTSRVGKSFAEAYYEKVLKREDFIYDPKKTVQTDESGVNSEYGEFTQTNTDSFFTSADETYIIRRVVINGILDGNTIKEDYFLIYRKA